MQSTQWQDMGMWGHYVVMPVTHFQRVWSQESDSDPVTRLGLDACVPSPASNPCCAHLAHVDYTVQFSNCCKCEKHAAALPYHFGCLSLSDLLCPPTLFPPPSSREGRRDHQAGSSRLHGITAVYIHLGEHFMQSWSYIGSIYYSSAHNKT